MYIIILSCFVAEIQNLTTKVNSPVYSAPPYIYTHAGSWC